MAAVKTISTALIASPLCALDASAQRDFSNVEIKATAVAGNVHVLVGAYNSLKTP